MRVIGGKYRGRKLKSPPDSGIRPTSDRLRETLFNILNPRIKGYTRFLDLCAGTGAVGIEAVSRGISLTTFVDNSRTVCALIEANVSSFQIPGSQFEIILSSTVDFFKRSNLRPWDIVYYDPPYQSDYTEALTGISDSADRILAEGGVIVAEHQSKLNLPDVIADLQRRRLVKQGNSSLSFYEMI